jgi:hypothetical protein
MDPRFRGGDDYVPPLHIMERGTGGEVKTAGLLGSRAGRPSNWIPAFAGMTGGEGVTAVRP